MKQTVARSAGTHTACDCRRERSHQTVASSNQTGAPAGTFRWLAAMAAPCASDLAANNVQRVGIVLRAEDEFWVNSFSCNAASEPWTVRPIQATMRLFHIAGMKQAFWQLALQPKHVSQFDAIWLLDSDIFPVVGHFALDRVEHWFHKTKAPVMQPIVQPMKANGKTSDYSDLRYRSDYDRNCTAKEVAVVEVQTPMLLQTAWSDFYFQVLGQLNHTNSVWGFDYAWCVLARRKGSACIAMNDVVVEHTDSQNIRNLLNVEDKDRKAWGMPQLHKIEKMVGFKKWDALKSTNHRRMCWAQQVQHYARSGIDGRRPVCEVSRADTGTVRSKPQHNHHTRVLTSSGSRFGGKVG